MIRLSTGIAGLLVSMLFLPVSVLAADTGQARVSLDTVFLAPLPVADPHSRVTVIGERPVVFSAESTRVYDDAGSTWIDADWRADGKVFSVASNGTHAFLFDDPGHGGHITRVRKLAFAAGQMAADPLPKLPAELASAEATIRGAHLVV
ncbi:MAG: hypothetical protein ACREQZ_08380, partial [Woeseiaceae bacterium]